MKKLLCLLLGAVLCVSVLAAFAGCATQGTDPDDTYNHEDDPGFDWSVYDVEDESVGLYNAVIYSYKGDWLQEDFLYDEANLIYGRYRNSDYVEGDDSTEAADYVTDKSLYPATRTYLIADRQAYDSTFVEGALDVDLETQLVVLYLLDPPGANTYYLCSIGVEGSTITVTASKHHRGPGYADAWYSYVSCLVAVMDNPGGITDAEFIDATYA